MSSRATSDTRAPVSLKNESSATSRSAKKPRPVQVASIRSCSSSVMIGTSFSGTFGGSVASIGFGRPGVISLRLTSHPK